MILWFCFSIRLLYGFVTQFFDVCILYIIDYTGNYCHLPKVNMCHWRHNDLLRRTNLIHFYIDDFIKMQYEFLKINLIRLTSYMKIEFDFFLAILFWSDPAKILIIYIWHFKMAFVGDHEHRTWQSAHFVSRFSDKISFKILRNLKEKANNIIFKSWFMKLYK